MNVFSFASKVLQHTQLQLPLSRMNALIAAFNRLEHPASELIPSLTENEITFAELILPHLNATTGENMTLTTPAFIQFAQHTYPLFNSPVAPIRAGMGLQAWFQSEHTGASSRYLAWKLSGENPAPFAEPQDWDDLERCVHFLIAVPESLEALRTSNIASESPRWAFVAANIEPFLQRQRLVLSDDDVPDELDIVFDSLLDKFHLIPTKH